MTTVAWDDRVLYAISAAAHEVTAARYALHEQIDTLASMLQAEQEATRAILMTDAKDVGAKLLDALNYRIEDLRTEMRAAHTEIRDEIATRIQLATFPPAATPPTVFPGAPIPAKGCVECKTLVSAYAIDRDGASRCLTCHETAVDRIARSRPPMRRGY